MLFEVTIAVAIRMIYILMLVMKYLLGLYDGCCDGAGLSLYLIGQLLQVTST